MNEQEFLTAILSDPHDDATLLVYSDWLCEHDDPQSADKAEYVRLSAASSDAGKVPSKKTRHRMQKLAAKLDTAWLATVSRLKIEKCLHSEPRSQRSPFEFECPKQWQNLRPTADPAVRSCDACRQRVFYCETIGIAREHALQGHCVAIDLGIVRRRGDIDPPRMLLGRISWSEIRREEAWEQTDAVSRRREGQRRVDSSVTSADAETASPLS